ncbi:MAG: hypothetical protein NUV65_06855 [Candidatus Roizmanbacteria bacterium]|nr:hypothetical protein [Candidatus Roizmanbacteria bacterium]
MKNESIQTKIRKLELSLVYLYQDANDKDNIWKNWERKQALYDALHAMMFHGLITDVDLTQDPRKI